MVTSLDPARITPRVSANAARLFQERYLHPGEDVAACLWRVASAVARAEEAWGTAADAQAWAERFYARLARFEFLPNSPTIRNAGTTQCLSACFTLEVPDDLDGIMLQRWQAARIIKAGGGVGFDFSAVRPRGWTIASTHRGACGPLALMRDYDLLADTLTQGAGAFRKGALMMTLRLDHPDSAAFIHAKDAGGALQNANISVLVDAEARAAIAGRPSPAPSCRCGGRTRCHCLALTWGGEVVDVVDARALWRAIAESAWRTGDPGVIFIDRANGDANPVAHARRITCANPCGEQLMGNYDNCTLASIDVGKFVRDGGLDEEGLAACVADVVRFLDDVVEVNTLPTPETARANRELRRIGLGVMGWADLLAALRIPYASEAAIALAHRVMALIRTRADAASAQLGRVRGVYPLWEGSAHAAAGVPYRNAFRTTVAPTGTIAILADCSSGIEPFFARSWERRTESGEVLIEEARAYAAWRAEGGSGDPPAWLATAHEIAPAWHVRHQAAFQRHVDNSISKTVNLPHDATVDDVLAVYALAAELGCKGVTVFRDGCREQQVLTARPTTPTACPTCGAALVAQEGCLSCRCGWSACAVSA